LKEQKKIVVFNASLFSIVTLFSSCDAQQFQLPQCSYSVMKGLFPPPQWMRCGVHFGSRTGNTLMGTRVFDTLQLSSRATGLQGDCDRAPM